MKAEVRTVRVRVDNLTRVLLAGLTVLLIVLIAGLWVYAVPSAPQAGAQARRAVPTSFGDAAKQREALVEAQKETNRKLDKILTFLQNGTVTVRISAQADPGKGGPKRDKP
jgi:hypothetical protein